LDQSTFSAVEHFGLCLSSRVSLVRACTLACVYLCACAGLHWCAMHGTNRDCLPDGDVGAAGRGGGGLGHETPERGGDGGGGGSQGAAKHGSTGRHRELQEGGRTGSEGGRSGCRKSEWRWARNPAGCVEAQQHRGDERQCAETQVEAGLHRRTVWTAQSNGRATQSRAKPSRDDRTQ